MHFFKWFLKIIGKKKKEIVLGPGKLPESWRPHLEAAAGRAVSYFWEKQRRIRANAKMLENARKKPIGPVNQSMETI